MGPMHRLFISCCSRMIPFGVRAGENPNAEQYAEQQAREILCNATARDSAFGLRRFDRSVEKRLDLAEAVGDDGAQLSVVRRHLKRGVDQKADPPFACSPNVRGSRRKNCGWLALAAASLRAA